MQALIDGCSSGYIPGKIVLAVSSHRGVFALERAEKAKIAAVVLERKRYKSDETYGRKLLKELRKKKADIVCLAGFVYKIPPAVVRAFRGRMLNIHPALLPGFGGKGKFGRRVHEAVLKSGAKISGCTVHYVDEKYDHGNVILRKKVPVRKNDTPEILAARVLRQEHIIYPRAVKKVIKELENTGGKS